MFFVLYDNEYKTKESKNLMEAKTEPQNACIVVNICSRFKIVQTSLFFSFVSQIHHHGLKENEKKKSQTGFIYKISSSISFFNIMEISIFITHAYLFLVWND